MAKKALTLLKGRRGKRPPVPAQGTATPPPPEYLGPRSRELWAKLAPALQRDGRLTDLTAPALAELVSAWAQVLVLRRDVESHGAVQTVTTKSGSPMERARPAAMLLADAEKRFRLMLQQFGLTPAAAKLVTLTDTDATDADPTAAYL